MKKLTILTLTVFAVFAFGKLGGEELNYSSDIDLLALFDEEMYAENSEAQVKVFSRVMERLRSHLADHTESGFVYRVDFRLRPYGRSGLLAHSLSTLSEYYRNSASDWERQALIKLRPVAGDIIISSDSAADVIKGFDQIELLYCISRVYIKHQQNCSYNECGAAPSDKGTTVFANKQNHILHPYFP